MIKRNLKIGYVIHLFALLHLLVAVLCLSTGIDDELLLTVLTMTMTVIICLKQHLSFEISAIFMILANIAGYLIGTEGGKLIASLVSSPIIVSGIATTLTTEIVGWTCAGVAHIIKKDNPKQDEPFLDNRIKLILSAVLIIFILRIAFATFLTANRFTHATILYILKEILSDSAAMITAIGLNIIYIGYAWKFQKKFRSGWKIVLVVLFLTASAAISTWIANADFFKDTFAGFSHLSFLQVFPVMFLVELTLFCIIYLIFSAVWSRQQMHQEREKANWEKYRYLRLKQQVNPHFLFNSLNILDCLVCEEKTEQASTYIHKLASIYRYFLRNEDNPTISLKDEMEFSNQYLDLLKVRFQDGFQVIQDVPEDCLQKHIIPCSLQMLIENAFKHNSVQPDKPLVIRIKAEGDRICVSNNLIPKIKSGPSTGLGQKYITQQYRDIAGRDVIIEHTETTYSVQLPLL